MSGSDSPGPRTASVEPMSGRRRGHGRIAGTGSRPASDRPRGSARRRLHPRTSAGTRAGSWGSQAVPRPDPTSCGLLKQRDKHHTPWVPALILVAGAVIWVSALVRARRLIAAGPARPRLT